MFGVRVEDSRLAQPKLLSLELAQRSLRISSVIREDPRGSALETIEAGLRQLLPATGSRLQFQPVERMRA